MNPTLGFSSPSSSSSTSSTNATEDPLPAPYSLPGLTPERQQARAERLAKRAQRDDDVRYDIPDTYTVFWDDQKPEYPFTVLGTTAHVYETVEAREALALDAFSFMVSRFGGNAALQVHVTEETEMIKGVLYTRYTVSGVPALIGVVSESETAKTQDELTAHFPSSEALKIYGNRLNDRAIASERINESRDQDDKDRQVARQVLWLGLTLIALLAISTALRLFG